MSSLKMTLHHNNFALNTLRVFEIHLRNDSKIHLYYLDVRLISKGIIGCSFY